MLLAGTRPSRSKSAPAECRDRHQTWAAPTEMNNTGHPSQPDA
ncbi:hypothetical protein SEA_RIALTO_48 [Mycobacterium phage Rialto]|nr:hypothetical protein SEA_RIALTO_48 [Mycobacterium phage Rialto]